MHFHAYPLVIIIGNEIFRETDVWYDSPLMLRQFVLDGGSIFATFTCHSVNWNLVQKEIIES